MPVDDRMRAQTQLILDGHEGAAAFPAPDRWDDVDDIDYLYREYSILTGEQDAERVAAAVTQILDQGGYGDLPAGEARQIQRERLSMRVSRLTVPPTPIVVPDILDSLDEDLGPEVGQPEHMTVLRPYAGAAHEPLKCLRVQALSRLPACWKATGTGCPSASWTPG